MMRSTDVKATITLDRGAKTLALCIAMLDNMYSESAKKIVRALATYYGVTL